MPTRREQLYSKRPREAAPSTQVSTLVKHKIDKSKKQLVPLDQDAKMLCALRKVLTTMSNASSNGERYFIAGQAVNVLKRESSPGAKEDEPGTYRAEGRFKMGTILRGRAGATYRPVAFRIGFRDSKDDLGLRDVEVLDENTSLDELPRNSQI